MHFPTERCTSCRKYGFQGAHGRKLQEIAGDLQGSRVKNASQLSQESWAPTSFVDVLFRALDLPDRSFRESPYVLASSSGKKKVYTTTVESLLFFFFWVWGSTVYTLLSGPMVYTLFPRFPRKMVYAIAFLRCDLGVGATDREKGGPTVVVYTLFSPVLASSFI